MIVSSNYKAMMFVLRSNMYVQGDVSKFVIKVGFLIYEKMFDFSMIFTKKHRKAEVF